jgi:hypothetical protein
VKDKSNIASMVEIGNFEIEGIERRSEKEDIP